MTPAQLLALSRAVRRAQSAQQQPGSSLLDQVKAFEEARAANG